MVEPVKTYLYRPVLLTSGRLSALVGRLQSGQAGLYLLYLVTVFILVLPIH